MRLALLAFLTFATPSVAEPSIAAAGLIGEETEAACGKAGGTFSDGAMAERDLTGDGSADLILSHGGVVCAGDQVQSDYCGAMMCSVLIYVRSGEVLTLAAEVLSAGGTFTLDEGEPPAIRLMNRDGSEGVVHWTGTAFQ